MGLGNHIRRSLIERQPYMRYAVSIIAFLAAATVTLPLKRHADYSSTTILLIAVMLSAWYGGIWPAMLVTVLSSFFSMFILFEPAYSTTIGTHELVRIVAFTLAAVIISSLTTRTRAAEERVRELNRDLEQRVKVRTTELEQANDRLRTFCYSVAHDLRAPLRSIQGFAQALSEDYTTRLDDTAQDYARRMMRSSARMDQLICDLLTYSNLTTREIPLGATDLDNCIERVLLEMEHQVLRARAQVDVQSPLGRVLGHPATVELLFKHLLDNAIKFVPRGDIPHVRIWTEPRDERIRLAIQDKGIGIDPGQHRRIFGVFQRGHGTNEYPGTGIGLAMVSAAAHQMNARIGLKSVPGEGSCFWVEFAQAPPPSDDQRERQISAFEWQQALV